MTDRLTLARALENGGINRDAAEHIATEIFDAIYDNVATKSDLQALRTELKADLQAVRTELKSDFEMRIARLEHRLTVVSIRALVVSVGLILAAIPYLPHS